MRNQLGSVKQSSFLTVDGGEILLQSSFLVYLALQFSNRNYCVIRHCSAVFIPDNSNYNSMIFLAVFGESISVRFTTLAWSEHRHRKLEYPRHPCLEMAKNVPTHGLNPLPRLVSLSNITLISVLLWRLFLKGSRPWFPQNDRWSFFD